MDSGEPIKVALPLGIGDCHWACMKLRGIKALHGDAPLHAYVNESANHKTVGYLKIVPFIDEAICSPAAPDDINNQMNPGGYMHARWRTLAGCKGWRMPRPHPGKPFPGPKMDYLVVANGHVEQGLSMRQFIPEVPTDWEYELAIPAEDQDEATRLLDGRERPVVLYFSGLGPNAAFHGGWWKLKNWVRVCEELNKRGVEPVIIGADTLDDRGYYEAFLNAGGTGVGHLSLVGQTSIPVVMSICRRAAAWCGLNSGTGIVSAMMRTPTLMLWSDERWPCGVHRGFHPHMQTCWLSDEQRKTYRTMSYGHHQTTAMRVAWCIMEIAR